jgi:hypothetical protein
MPKSSKTLSADTKNRLVITEASKDENGELSKFTAEGKWSLSDENRLKLKVQGSKGPYDGKTLIFDGEIEKVTGHSLVFRARASENFSGMRTSTIELKGIWQADTANRLTFRVSKYRGEYDILRLQGAWKVDKNNEIIYTYEKTLLKRGEKTAKTLVFNGYWVLGKSRLVYRLDHSKDSFFSFKAAMQSNSLRAADGVIRYQVGVKYYRGRVYRSIRRSISIFGVWKVEKDLCVRFEVQYSGGKRRSIEFGVEKMLGERASITVSLKNEFQEKPGIEVRFSKKLKNDAELFLELSRMKEESRIVGGIKVAF